MGKGDLPVTFGEWLKQQRKRLDLTQDELAQRAGCSIFALRKIEAGERRPSKQLAALLACALEVPPEEQEIFLRVARGERPVERLPLPSSSRAAPVESASNTVASPSALPKPETRLIGREPELAAIERIFNQPHCRLITLTGPGGIGKTRLAIEFASGQFPAFLGGVFYVPLASLESASLIIPTIAEAVGFTFSGPANLKEQLFSFLKRQIQLPTLFVLDNVEHLLEPAASTEIERGASDLVAEILQLLPDIKILATSRERLNLRGEWTYELHGLAVPPDELIGKMENYSAVELFIQRARQTKADFYQEAEQQQDILRICKFLDGIPLAIELAAAWVGVLTCAEIAREIETNFDLLTTTMHDFPRRHRSIRAAIDHSWKLLHENERQVLQRLSVFRGGFYRDAAAQITGASLPLLASLVSKSLVRRTESGRYDLHEVVRQYAYSFLCDHPQKDQTHDAHCLFYLGALRDREKALKSAKLQETMRELLDEMENIRLAWAWAIDHHYFAALQQAARALGWLYETTGLLQEGIGQFELLVRELRKETLTPEVSRLLGEALTSQSLLYFRKGDFSHAQERLEESIALLRPLKNPSPIPDPFLYLGIIKHSNGELDHSRALIQEGLVLARAIGDLWFEAHAIFNVGYIATLSGQYDEGYVHMSEAMTLWRSLGDPYSISMGLNYLSSTLIKLGWYKLASDGLEESIHLCASSGNRWGAGTAYRNLGLVNIAMQKYTEAQSHFRKSLELFSGFTTGWDIANSTIYLAQATLLSGNLTEARRTYIEGLCFAISARAPSLALGAILGIANIRAEMGLSESALELAYFIQNHPSAFYETLENASQLSLCIEKQISPDQADSIRKKAVERSLESIGAELTARE